MATTAKQSVREQLKNDFATIDANEAQEIREAYYKAVEGLHSLAELLSNHKDKEILGKELLLATEAMRSIGASSLGSYL